MMMLSQHLPAGALDTGDPMFTFRRPVSPPAA
jgi:hypothetical protein